MYEKKIPRKTRKKSKYFEVMRKKKKNLYFGLKW